MSHLIEEYAKNLGVKIGKPVLTEHFFPVIPEKYITVSVEPQIPSKQYKYFDIVFDSVRSFLDKQSIKIIQIGSSKSKKLTSVDEMIFDLDFKKQAYIVQNSLLHIGGSDALMHYASFNNIPIVALFGDSYAACSDGYWSSAESKTNIEAPWEVKPSFNAFDQQDSINKILPEEIANAIIKKFAPEASFPLKTRFIGDFYHHPVFELVPDFFSQMPGMVDKHWFIRLDYLESYSYVESWCEYLPSFSFFADKMIPHQFILNIKDRLKNITFIVNEETVLSDDYLNYISGLGISVSLLVKDPSILPIIRNKYFNFNVQIYALTDKSILKDKKVSLGSSVFHSRKIVVARGKKYPSTYHWKKDKNILDKNLVIEDNELLLSELNYFYIYDTK
ncbi:MAG: hypothetical protein EHM20_12830 [Alphaproteobacteria bacterium]|jgi:hypothetical protein|nr:MAG: hypothetical protein EHM20_12830 [Alphaproteobacteria bacterium]